MDGVKGRVWVRVLVWVWLLYSLSTDTGLITQDGKASLVGALVSLRIACKDFYAANPVKLEEVIMVLIIHVVFFSRMCLLCFKHYYLK